jgi:pyridoxine/pyridoxamine 5'-phosphate oxidase
MDKTIQIFGSLEAMKADEYRYWQSRPAHERMAAVAEMTRAVYAMKRANPDVRRLPRTLVCLQRPQR